MNIADKVMKHDVHMKLINNIEHNEKLTNILSCGMCWEGQQTMTN